jgi:hypothetical protein
LPVWNPWLSGEFEILRTSKYEFQALGALEFLFEAPVAIRGFYVVTL